MSIDNVGDVDGDGRDDVGVAASDIGEGALILACGRTGRCLRLLDGWRWRSPAREFAGSGERRDRIVEQAEAGFAQWIRAAGDVDGDGLGDILLGARARWPGGSRAWLLSGPSLVAYAGFDGPYQSPRAIAVVGDFDGDGCRDVAVGVNGLVSNRLRIMTARDTRAIAHVDWVGGSLAERKGDGNARALRIASAGDVDRDGRDDVLVGVGDPEWAGVVDRVELVSSRTRSVMRVYDTAGMASSWRTRR